MLRLWQLLQLRWNPFRAFVPSEVPEIYQPWNGDVEALLEMARGAVVELVGETGSGKSTLATALELAARRRGIATRLVYLPPEFTWSRCWLPSRRGELLIIDEVERLCRATRYWLTKVRIRHLFGLVVTRHPTPAEARPAQTAVQARPNGDYGSATEQLSGTQEGGLRCSDQPGRRAQAQAWPTPYGKRRRLGMKVPTYARHVVRLAPFDAARVIRFYEARMRWSGCACPPPLDDAAAKYLVRLARGNGRWIQWALYELFQCRVVGVPERINVELVDLGVQRQQQSQTSECPDLCSRQD